MGIYVGYRYFTSVVKSVKHPFGFGLFYTGFACGHLRVEPNEIEVTVTNIGQFIKDFRAKKECQKQLS